MSAASPLQLDLDLEPGPPADTPPPCGCCQGRRNLLEAWGGWLVCTWCEGTGADPLVLSGFRDRRHELVAAGELLAS